MNVQSIFQYKEYYQFSQNIENFEDIMYGKIIQIIIETTSIKCPLCIEKFRLRLSLRFHLRDHHTQVEGNQYIERKLKEI